MKALCTPADGHLGLPSAPVALLALLATCLLAPTALGDRLAVKSEQGVLRIEAPVPPGPAADAANAPDPAGWSCLVIVDARATDGKEGEAPELVLDGHALAFRSVADGARLVARTPAEFDAARSFQVELEGTAKGLRVERVHASPSAALVGKANGHLGPDRLDVAPLGFVGLTEHECCGLCVLEVRDGAAAARAGVRVGDVILALEGEPLPPSNIAPGEAWFERSHEAVFGRALEDAARSGREQLGLEVLRGDAVLALAVDQPYLPDRFDLEGDDLGAALDAGFPLRGPLGDALHADLLGWARANERAKGGWRGTDAVNPALGALALLGSGEVSDRAAAKRAIDFMLEKHPSPSEMRGLAYWTIGFLGSALCEWHLLTGDDSVLPWIEEAIDWLPTTTHICKWGMPAFGHGPDGIPYDDKALIAPAAHLLVFEALARRCGVESGVWEHIEAYVVHSWSDPDDDGHGAMGYNASYKDRGEFWSRSGLIALAEHLRGDDETGMREPLCAIMEERHQWMFNSHAYGEPGGALGLVSLAVADRAAFERVIAQYRWRFLVNWEPGFGLRYTTPHMGAPYMGGESIVNLAYLLLFAVEPDEERSGLVMAGR